MYISVNDAASKFNISKRRVQVLCEQGRIDGANMVSGVWLIPDTASKPIDGRRKHISCNKADQIGVVHDIFKIMCSQGNWPYFEPYFGFSNAQEWIRTTFETIEKSRNVIMHSGVLDELDVARVGMNIIDWLHQINA